MCGGHTGGSGIQHSKTLLVDNYLIAGSCNWTNSSRLNTELSVLVHLSEEGARSHVMFFHRLKQSSTLVTDAQVDMATEIRVQRKGRAKSIARLEDPQPTAYKTAKRFSMARAKSLEKDMVSPRK